MAGKPLKTHKQDLTLHWPAARLHYRRGGAPHRILLPRCTAWPAQCLQMPRSLPMQFWFFQRLPAAAGEHLPLEAPAARSSRTPARRSQLSAGAFTVLPPEIMHRMLSSLPPGALRSLRQCSKACRSLIGNHATAMSVKERPLQGQVALASPSAHVAACLLSSIHLFPANARGRLAGNGAAIKFLAVRMACLPAAPASQPL